MTNMKTKTLALLLAGGVILAAAPALAQTVNRGTQPGRTAQPPGAPQAEQPAQRRYNLSRGEQNALNPLLAANTAANDAQTAGQTGNWAAVQALLPAAQAAARGDDAKYLVARVQLSIALGTNNLAGQEAAITILLANPTTPAPEQANYRSAQSSILNRRAEAAFTANDFATAERIYRQLLQASPNDTRIQTNLRIIQERVGNSAGALENLLQQIRAAEAGGGRAAEDLYRRAVDIPRRAGQRPQAATALQQLVTAYPTPDNWRTAIDFLRETPAEDIQLLVDIYRLARTANVLRAQEYPALANTLIQASFFGEAKAVIDAGVAARTITGNEPEVRTALGLINARIAQDRAGLDGEVREARGSGTALQARNVGDALYGYARYAEAAELYRVALTKGGDANVLNTRIGVSLAMAGQRPAAETALRAVTGPRAELAAFWLAWLNRRQG